MDVNAENLDLFADDHESLGQLVDRLDQIPTTELTAKWPKALAELVDVLACELVRGGMEPDLAKALARKLALVQAVRKTLAATPEGASRVAALLPMAVLGVVQLAALLQLIALAAPIVPEATAFRGGLDGFFDAR